MLNENDIVKRCIDMNGSPLVLMLNFLTQQKLKNQHTHLSSFHLKLVHFLNFYLAILRPTLGYSRGDSLTNPMFITAFLSHNFDPKVTGRAPCGVWNGNLPILIATPEKFGIQRNLCICNAPLNWNSILIILTWS